MSADIVIDWMLSTGLDISILIALVLAFRRPFGRMFGAAAAYSLWLLPFIRLFLPEIPITIPRPSWMHSPVTSAPEYFEFSAAVPAAIVPASEPLNWQLPALIVWFGVALIWLGYQFAKQRTYLSDVLRDSEPASGKAAASLEKACTTLRLKRVPDIRLSNTNVGPIVTGIVNPVIVLPNNFATAYNREQQFLALTHELAHIKRFDLVAAFSTLVFRALNWPNPLVHWAAQKFRADQEAACDAYVLNTVGGGQSTTQSYAETLIHSARLNRFTSSSTDVAATNPLCLTIHHPLKERLMTMKNAKTHSTILSRVGVATFLAAGLAVTAPITIANAQQNDPVVKTQMKKVIKSVENHNGVETTKTFEITEEDGVTTIYSIDEHGNKTVISEDELGDMNMMGHDMDIMVLGDGQHAEKRIKIISGDDMHVMGDGQHGQIIVKRMKKGEDGTSFEADENVFVFSDGDYTFGEGAQAAAMVGAAKSLLEQVETMQGNKELSSKAKRKLEKARKALEEAQAALDAE